MFKSLKTNRSIRKIVIIIVLAVLILPNLVMAQTSTLTKGCEIPRESGNRTEQLGIVVDTYEPIDINFNLPGVTEKVVENGKTYYQVKNLQCFIIGIYVYFSGVAGILATVMIMYGGVKYVISMGNPSRMGDAKDTIFSASVGLVLVLGAYVLLNLINPNLTSLKVPGLNLANVAAIPEYCTNNAVPKIPGKTSCGDFGVEIINQDDPNTTEIETIKRDCMYFSCDSTYSKAICFKGTLKDPNADEYNCMNPAIRCNSVNDSQKVDEAQYTCRKYDQKGLGICVWHDESWASEKQDKCWWHGEINCPNGSWTKVECSEGCPDSTCQKNAAWRGTGFKCTDAEEVYNEYPLGNKPAICCKKTIDTSSNSFYSGNYNVGDFYCSNQFYDPYSKKSYF